MANNNTAFTTITGENYGGLTAGQVNISDGEYSTRALDEK